MSSGKGKAERSIIVELFGAMQRYKSRKIPRDKKQIMLLKSILDRELVSSSNSILCCFIIFVAILPSKFHVNKYK